jgi:hypothetical protein
MVAGRTTGAVGDGRGDTAAIGDGDGVGDGDGDDAATDVVAGRDDAVTPWDPQAATATAASAQMTTRALTPASIS